MFNGLSNYFRNKLEKKSGNMVLSDPAAASLFFGYGPTASGTTVNHANALSCAPVHACVKVISEAVAVLPLVLYKKTADGGRTKAEDHPLFELLAHQPNEWSSSYDLRITMQADLSLWGNAFAFVNRDNSGRVVEIIRISPDNVCVSVNTLTQQPVFRITSLDGASNEYDCHEIMHLRGLGAPDALGSYTGISPVIAAREAIGICLAIEEHVARLFGSGARPAGIFTFPGTLTQPVLDRLRGSLSTQYSGGANSGKTAILEGRMKFEPLQFSSVDNELISLRHFAVEEICRVWKVQPHKIAAMERSTNNNIEKQAAEFLTDTLLPQLRCWTEGIRRCLFTPEERAAGYYAEFLVDDLVRADIEKRFAAYSVGIINGILSPNECRAQENLPGYGEQGDVYTRQLNTAAVDATPAAVAPDPSAKEPWL